MHGFGGVALGEAERGGYVGAKARVVAEREHRGEGPGADDHAAIAEGPMEKREYLVAQLGRAGRSGEELAGGEPVDPVIGGVEPVGDADEIVRGE